MSQSETICIPNEFFRKSNKIIILRKTMMIDSRFGFNFVVFFFDFVFGFLHHIIGMLAQVMLSDIPPKKPSVYVYVFSCIMQNEESITHWFDDINL